MFPPCFVIHLKTAHDREQNIFEQFRNMDVPLTVFPAVDCNDMSALLTNLQKLNPKCPIVNMSRQELACYLSHTRVLNYINEHVRDHEFAIIFEDDFVFKNDSAALFQLLGNLKFGNLDVDICFLGTLTNYTGLPVNEYFTKVTSEYIGNLWGTHAYTVKCSSIPRILEELREPTLAIDGKYQEISNAKINTYVVRENLFIQSPDLPSYIRTENYK